MSIRRFPFMAWMERWGLGGRGFLIWYSSGGALGCISGFFLQVATQIWIYPTIVQGKPSNIFTLPAFFPVLFELTILFSALTVMVGFFIFSQLPRLNHPLFESKQFHRASDDGFFISIEARDARFNREQTLRFLEEIGGKDIELVEEPQ